MQKAVYRCLDLCFGYSARVSVPADKAPGLEYSCSSVFICGSQLLVFNCEIWSLVSGL